MNGPIETARDDFTPLTEDEIDAFFNDLDRDKDGYVTNVKAWYEGEDIRKYMAPKSNVSKSR